MRNKCQICGLPGSILCPTCAQFKVIFSQNLHSFMEESESEAANYAKAMISEGKIDVWFARDKYREIRKKVRGNQIAESEAEIEDILEEMPISQEQAQAVKVVLNNKNTLITARAGSGKTHLLLCIIFVLITRLNVKKDHILMLSFNRSVRENNSNDLHQKFEIEEFHGVHTFNSLAFQIVKPPRQKVLESKEGASEQIKHITDLVKKGSSISFRFKCWLYLKEIDTQSILIDEFVTSLGERVKSYGEVLIANLLLKSAIEYQYEPNYKWGDTEYLPDFSFAVDNKTYIVEYWGVSEHGYNRDNEMQVQYIKQIKQKRLYWEAQGSTLIEMSIDDFKQGPDQFSEIFKEKLTEFNIRLVPLSEEQLVEVVFKKRFSTIADDILSFINYARVQRISYSVLQGQLNTGGLDSLMKRHDKIFTELAVEVYGKYIDHLKNENLWDFNRMVEESISAITHAKGEIDITLDKTTGHTVSLNNVEWILVDEFQDLSPLFYDLLSTIRNFNSKVRFVCVGDDWQAINGFAGSDIKFMEKFEDYFTSSARAQLPTNRRSTAAVVDLGNLIMDGYGTRALKLAEGGKALLITVAKELTPKGDPSAVGGIYTKLKEIINTYSKETSFHILYRKKVIFTKPLSHIERVLKNETRKHNINVSTIHSVKGDQADVVIIVEDKKSLYPLSHPKTAQKQILGLTEQKVEMEERRLFYVAVTRAIKDVYIITVAGESGGFVRQLIPKN